MITNLLKRALFVGVMLTGSLAMAFFVGAATMRPESAAVQTASHEALLAMDCAAAGSSCEDCVSSSTVAFGTKELGQVIDWATIED